MSTCKEVLETWFRRVWTEQDANAIDELFIPDGAARGLGGNVLIGPAGFREFHSALRGLLTDFVITIDKSVQEDDWISAVCTLRARSRQTATPIEITGSVMIRISDGKLMEAYNHWDFINMFGQLGLLPTDAFVKALGGETII
jgi:hypothetical protein